MLLCLLVLFAFVSVVCTSTVRKIETASPPHQQTQTTLPQHAHILGGLAFSFFRNVVVQTTLTSANNINALPNTNNTNHTNKNKVCAQVLFVFVWCLLVFVGVVGVVSVCWCYLCFASVVLLLLCVCCGVLLLLVLVCCF